MYDYLKPCGNTKESADRDPEVVWYQREVDFSHLANTMDG